MNSMNILNNTSDSLKRKLKEPPEQTNLVGTGDSVQKHQSPSVLDEPTAAGLITPQGKIQGSESGERVETRSGPKSAGNSKGKFSPDGSLALYFLFPLLRYPRVSLAIALAGLFLTAWHFCSFRLLQPVVTTTPIYFLMQVILFILYGHCFSLRRFSRRSFLRTQKTVGQEAAKALVFTMLVFAPMYSVSAVLMMKTYADADRSFQQSAYQKAAELYSKLDALTGGKFYVFRRAQCEEHLGKYQNAADMYSETLVQAPSLGLYTARAKIFDKLGKNDLAQKDRTAAIQLRKTLGDVASAQIFFDNGQSDEALQIYNQMVARQPNSAKNYVLRAKCLYQLKKYSATIEDLNHAIVLYPKFGQAFYIRAEAYEKLGEQNFAKRDRAEAAALGYRH
jgi:tetratricopeptide (TPR) repeat protein